MTFLDFFLQGGGWVHAVSFSADGNKLAWVGHDSSISVADATKYVGVAEAVVAVEALTNQRQWGLTN